MGDGVFGWVFSRELGRGERQPTLQIGHRKTLEVFFLMFDSICPCMG